MKRRRSGFFGLQTVANIRRFAPELQARTDHIERFFTSQSCFSGNEVSATSR
jgi:hypothetical protein